MHGITGLCYKLVMAHITPPNHSADICLLLIRLIIGISFIVAAHNKNRDIKKFAKTNGLPVPAAQLVAGAEFISGLAMILGTLTQYATIVIMLLMLGTLRLHIFKWKSPYWASAGGWEYDLMMFTMALTIFVFGPGAIS